jgi:hypothetical protein
MRRRATKSIAYAIATHEVIADTNGPLMNAETYRRVEAYKTANPGGNFPSEKDIDPEYATRWGLSNLRKRRLVRHVARGRWEITEAGRKALVDDVLDGWET